MNGEASLRYWTDRLTRHNVQHTGIVTRDGRLHVDFEDPDGFVASLVEDGGVGEAHPWEHSPVPAEHQIGSRLQRHHGAGASAHARLPDQVLNLIPDRTYPHHEAPEHDVHVFHHERCGPAAELHVAVRPDLPRARYGSGGVHHVALDPDYDQYHRWTERLEATGMAFSGEVDRFYFRSLYIREPGGILIELATDGPGFHHDEPSRDHGPNVGATAVPRASPQRIEPLLKAALRWRYSQNAAPGAW